MRITIAWIDVVRNVVKRIEKARTSEHGNVVNIFISKRIYVVEQHVVVNGSVVSEPTIAIWELCFPNRVWLK